jgi:glutamate-1-semialdehyde 2,1-aminomutase
MKPEVPTTYRAAYMTPKENEAIQALLDHLFDNGIIMISTCSGTLSTAMTEKEIEILTETLLEGFRRIKTMF